METEENTLTKRIISFFYPSMMMLFVFTLADNLLKKLVFDFSIETLLFVILWFFTAIQISLARIRGVKWNHREYPISALLMDLVDVLCAVYLCSMLGGYKETPLSSYLHITGPYIGVAIAQFFWFVFMRSFDIPAMMRLLILFVGMVAISISELLCHSIWNLVAAIILITILAVLRIWNKAPSNLQDKIQSAWNNRRAGKK